MQLLAAWIKGYLQMGPVKQTGLQMDLTELHIHMYRTMAITFFASCQEQHLKKVFKVQFVHIN
jgi:hypothetical protein